MFFILMYVGLIGSPSGIQKQNDLYPRWDDPRLTISNPGPQKDLLLLILNVVNQTSAHSMADGFEENTVESSWNYLKNGFLFLILVFAQCLSNTLDVCSHFLTTIAS